MKKGNRKVYIWWGFLSDTESHKEDRRKPEIAYVWMIEKEVITFDYYFNFNLFFSITIENTSMADININPN